MAEPNNYNNRIDSGNQDAGESGDDGSRTPPQLPTSTMKPVTPEQMSQMFFQFMSQMMAGGLPILQNQNAGSSASGENGTVRKSVQWSLIKTLCPIKLDLKSATNKTFRAWERGLRAFVLEVNLISYEWETQSMAIETTMEAESFHRVEAIRQQLEASKQESFEDVVQVIKDLVDGNTNIWVQRYAFHQISQQGQSVRQFYANVVEQAAECGFSEGYCKKCAQKAIDDQVLQKLIFSTSRETARTEMLKNKHLDLITAKKVLEDDEALKQTEQTLTSYSQVQNIQTETDMIQAIQSRGRQTQNQNYNRSRSQPARQRYRSLTPPMRHPSASRPQTRNCPNCGGYNHKTRDACPARGSTCRKCNRRNHWARVCMTDPDEGEWSGMKNQAIISAMGSSTEYVSVVIEDNLVNAVVDTGSDWNCCSVEILQSVLHESPYNLLPPTEAMRTTKTANGNTMEAKGYFNTEFVFGSKSVLDKIVVFSDVQDFYLSKDCLKKLGVVVINTKPPVPEEVNSPRSIKPDQPEAVCSVQRTNETTGNYDDDQPLAQKKRGRNNHRSKAVKEKRKLISNILKEKRAEDITKDDLLKEFEDVFAERMEPIEGEEFQIILRDGAIPSKVYEPRPVPYELEAKLKAEIETLVDQDMIEPVTHPTEWTHPIVVAPKKDTDKIRLAIDFRRLNEYVVGEKFHSPPVIEVVQRIEADKATKFSKGDAAKGFHQLPLEEKCRDYTTFLTPFGRYRFKRAPYGITSVPDHFNRRMTEEFQEIPCMARVVDDNLIYGKTSADLAVNTVRYLQRCRERGIRLHKDKFVYNASEIEFAGLLISGKGFTIHPKIVEALSAFPIPRSVTDMRSFQGLANQLAPYDEELAHKLAPLRHLLKRHNKFEMTADEIQAFEEVKKQLASPRTLAYYCPGQPVQMFTDAACTKGYGFILNQKQKDGKWKPIMLGSRSLTSAEYRYAPIEAELNALTWALRKAQKFLLGATKFIVFTDHRPLVSLVNKRRLDEVANSRLLRNLIKCQDYNLHVEYVKGAHNAAADSLSRHPTSSPDETDVAESEAVSYHVRTIQAACTQEAEYTMSEEKLLRVADEDPQYQMLKNTVIHGFPDKRTQLDPCLTEYWNIRNELWVSDDDFILYGSRLLIPKDLRRQTLSDLHNGHKGMDLTKARARLTVYWPRIDSEVENYCRSCKLCEYDRPSQSAEPEIHLPSPQRCFQYISADFGDVNGNKYLITADWRSGWFNTRHMNCTDASHVIKELRAQFMDTAVPEVLYTDGGPPFNSQEYADFCRRWGVRNISSSAYYPRSNSFAENGVKQAKALLRKCTVNGRLDPDLWAKGLLSVRNTPHKGTSLSPAVILYGHQIRELVPVHKSALNKNWHKQVSDLDRRIARERQRVDAWYRPGKPLPPLKVGDPVLIQNRSNRRWDKVGIVQERNLNIRKYAVRLPSGMVTHRNRRDLRKRYPPDSVPTAGTKDWNPFSGSSKQEYVDKWNTYRRDIDNDNDDDDDWNNGEDGQVWYAVGDRVDSNTPRWNQSDPHPDVEHHSPEIEEENVEMGLYQEEAERDVTPPVLSPQISPRSILVNNKPKRECRKPDRFGNWVGHSVRFR